MLVMYAVLTKHCLSPALMFNIIVPSDTAHTNMSMYIHSTCGRLFTLVALPICACSAGGLEQYAVCLVTQTVPFMVSGKHL